MVWMRSAYRSYSAARALLSPSMMRSTSELSVRVFIAGSGDDRPCGRHPSSEPAGRAPSTGRPDRWKETGPTNAPLTPRPAPGDGRTVP